ncbi:TatD family hydrolase [Kiritimatiellaeota bacterium B1221]|nr:TatD family hydrolase [Kiritimatiellaeota bacterium B1221]
MISLTDAHCHLQDPAFAGEMNTIIDRAKNFGIRRFVVNGTCPEDWSKVEDLAKNHSEVLPQFGVHPWKVADLPVNWMEKLKGYLLRFPLAGLGEIGLDRKLTDAPISQQIEIFRQQVELACEYHRPCTFHIVKAWEEFWSVLKEQAPEKFLLHSFRGSAEQVKAFEGYEAYFSFGGAVLRHPNSKKMAAALQAVPEDRMLLETDAPYQHPQGLRVRQEPAGLLVIAEKSAEIRGERLETVLKNCEANAAQLFGAPPFTGLSESKF